MDQYVVTANSLHIRSKPTISGEIIGFLVAGDVVEKIDVSGDEYWYKIKSDAHGFGWCSHKYLRRKLDPQTGIPDWLGVAQQEIGVKEFPGSADNPRIVQYLRSTTLPAPSNMNDETPWCSAFVNWCVETSGVAGTDSAWARSWMNWGNIAEMPRIGSIAVFTRDGGGHVGFYMGETSNRVKVLGGNQSDAVNVKSYPKSRLLGYRDI